MAEDVQPHKDPNQAAGPPTGNVWTRKYGSLPLWAWAGIGLAIVVAIMYWRNKNSSSSSTTNAAVPTGASSTTAGQVPQFVNQVYTQTSPGTTPAPTPTPGTPTMAYRDTAPGNMSLDQYAKSRNTTAAHLIATTQGAHITGGITDQNLAAFMKYVAGGTSKKMPKGLVFYTSNPNPISKGGLTIPATATPVSK